MIAAIEVVDVGVGVGAAGIVLSVGVGALLSVGGVGNVSLLVLSS